jgi:hypothetical protein
MATSQTKQSDEAGQELAVVHSSTEIAELDKFDQILLGMADAPEVVDDPDEVSRQIVLQLLAATTDAELTISQATGWRDLMDVPIEIQGFRWRKSDYEEGAPVYVLVAGARLDTGEYLPAITTGSYNVLAQLSNLARRGQLPGAVWQLTESEKQTARGFKPLWLTKTPDEVVDLHRSVNSGGNPLDEPDES